MDSSVLSVFLEGEFSNGMKVWLIEENNSIRPASDLEVRLMQTLQECLQEKGE